MTLDYTCAHCGATETYTLVPAARETDAPARPVPELDFTCSSCGATDTYTLVKS
jgi:predicted nucleic-acid-binding Zn-ribbon protein